MIRQLTLKKWLDMAQAYAEHQSGCRKVKVGAVIIKDNKVISFGANRAIPDLCQTPRGCMRVEKYGDNAKSHRNPEDCRAIHSEIDAISSSKEDLTGAVMYVTRYPCEACARAIVASGIKMVVFGRGQDITEETRHIFEDSKVEYMWRKDWEAEDTTV